MNPRSLAFSVIIVAVLGVTGCGSDSKSAASSRSATVAALVKSAKDSGVKVDAACAAKVVDTFSDGDYTLVEKSIAADNLDPKTLSAEGQKLVIELFDCSGGVGGGTVPAGGGLTTTQAAILAELETGLGSSGATLDHACLEKLVTELDAAAIATQDSAVLASLGVRAAACVQQP